MAGKPSAATPAAVPAPIMKPRRPAVAAAFVAVLSCSIIRASPSDGPLPEPGPVAAVAQQIICRLGRRGTCPLLSAPPARGKSHEKAALVTAWRARGACLDRPFAPTSRKSPKHEAPNSGITASGRAEDGPWQQAGRPGGGAGRRHDRRPRGG